MASWMDGWINEPTDGCKGLPFFYMKRLTCHLNVSKFHNNTLNEP